MPTPDTVDGFSWWSGFDGALQTLLILGLPVLITVAVVSVIRNTAAAASQAWQAAQDEPATDEPSTVDMVDTSDDMPFPGFDPDMYGTPDL